MDSPATRPLKAPRIYTCRICAKTFKRSEHCSRHERGHTGERPFGCKFCGRRYARKDLVGRHEKTFHATDMGYGGHGQTQPRQEKTTDTNLKYSEIPQEQFMESGVQGQIINDFEVAGMAAPAYNLHTSMHDQPIHDQSIHDQPIHDQSIHDQSIHDQPIHEGFVYETANTSFNGNENITHTNSEPIHQEFYTAEDCIDPNLGALPQPPQTFAQPTHQDAYHNHTAEDCIDPSLG